MLLTLRVVALYRSVRWATRLLWIAFAIFQGLRSGIILYGDVVIFSKSTLKQQSQQTDFLACRGYYILSYKQHVYSGKYDVPTYFSHCNTPNI